MKSSKKQPLRNLFRSGSRGGRSRGQAKALASAAAGAPKSAASVAAPKKRKPRLTGTSQAARPKAKAAASKPRPSRAAAAVSKARTRALTLTTADLPSTPGAAVASPAVRQAITSLFGRLDRTEIIEALSRAEIEQDVNMKRLCAMLQDPAYEDLDWPALCRASGVAPRDLLRSIAEAYVAEGEFRAARQIPAVMEQVAKAAIDEITDCMACGGEGLVTVFVEAEDESLVERRVRCQSDGCVRGKVKVPGSLLAARLAMESVGVLGGKPGFVLNQQFNGGGTGPRRGNGNGGDPSVPDMSDWSRNTDAVLEERRPTEYTDAAFTEAQSDNGSESPLP